MNKCQDCDHRWGVFSFKWPDDRATVFLWLGIMLAAVGAVLYF
jgi:hypothetical protein